MPDPLDMPLEMADAAGVAKELQTLLRQALPRPSSPLPLTLQGLSVPALSDRARVQLASMGIQLGDRVVIARQKASVTLPSKQRRASLCPHVCFKDVLLTSHVTHFAPRYSWTFNLDASNKSFSVNLSCLHFFGQLSSLN